MANCVWTSTPHPTVPSSADSVSSRRFVRLCNLSFTLRPLRRRPNFEFDSAVRSYYGISRNLLIKFRDDSINETPRLAHILSTESALSSMMDMSIPSLPGDRGLPLQQSQNPKEIDLLVDVITSWMASNSGPILNS
ncbi:hypothetical protein AAHA92_18499 [Salvia divinorum]|uniref:Uncharacterized protein n=1 Tax=Salvia divinorum TaxID=28513 RepID=A0ABD1H2A8_SALDI